MVWYSKVYHGIVWYRILSEPAGEPQTCLAFFLVLMKMFELFCSLLVGEQRKREAAYCEGLDTY